MDDLIALESIIVKFKKNYESVETKSIICNDEKYKKYMKVFLFIRDWYGYWYSAVNNAYGENSDFLTDEELDKFILNIPKINEVFEEYYYVENLNKLFEMNRTDFYKLAYFMDFAMGIDGTFHYTYYDSIEKAISCFDLSYLFNLMFLNIPFELIDIIRDYLFIFEDDYTYGIEEYTKYLNSIKKLKSWQMKIYKKNVGELLEDE